jgi:3-hexulose-6-phosphate synthase/6-phospho-3-hexuloisomerase
MDKLSTAALCDAHSDVSVMEGGLRTFNRDPLTRVVGRAYTVNSAGDALSTMVALDDLPNFILELGCKDDRVPFLLIIASCGTKLDMLGGMCAETAKLKGYGGIITDGNCRDVAEIQNNGLPVFAKGTYPRSTPKQTVGKVKIPITCGDVYVNPGDIVMADSDGIIVLSKETAIAAVNKAEVNEEKEAIARKEIQGGARFDEICNLKEHIEKRQREEPSTLNLTI